MEKIPPPKITERELANKRIVIDTEHQQILIECFIYLKDENGVILSVTPCTVMFRHRDLYEKDGMLYSPFKRAYNFLLPQEETPTKDMRTFLHDRARALVKEHMEQVEGLESGTLVKETIPDPDPEGPAPEDPRPTQRTQSKSSVVEVGESDEPV